jgi:hypothetical protein
MERIIKQEALDVLLFPPYSTLSPTQLEEMQD